MFADLRRARGPVLLTFLLGDVLALSLSLAGCSNRGSSIESDTGKIVIVQWSERSRELVLRRSGAVRSRTEMRAVGSDSPGSVADSSAVADWVADAQDEASADVKRSRDPYRIADTTLAADIQTEP
jgi:uncharacterized lipoprotein NlpE involved in copper resistance